MATRTISNAGGNWSATSAWAEGAVPTASDDVVATATSGNLTIDTSAAVCRSMDLTGYTSTLTHGAGIVATIGAATAGPGNVALYFPPGMTYVRGSTTSAFTLVNSVAAVQTIDLSGITNAPVFNFNGTGSVKLLSGWTGISIIHNTGTLDTNSQNFTLSTFTGISGNIRTLKLGSSSILVTGAGAAATFSTATNLTVSANTATITLNASTAKNWNGGSNINWNGLKIVFTGAGASTFSGTNGSYGGLTWSGASVLNWNGSNTFTNLSLTVSGTARTVTMAASATNTITNSPVIHGSSTATLTFVSATPGTQWTLSVASGIVSADYLSLTDSKAQGGATFYAGSHSTNVSNNTGWTFTDTVISSTDSAGGGGAESVNAQIPGTDSSGISSSESISASATSTDSSGATETQTAQASLAGSDSAGASDTSTITASVAYTDSAGAIEGQSLTASLTGFDAAGDSESQAAVPQAPTSIVSTDSAGVAEGEAVVVVLTPLPEPAMQAPGWEAGYTPSGRRRLRSQAHEPSDQSLTSEKITAELDGIIELANPTPITAELAGVIISLRVRASLSGVVGAQREIQVVLEGVREPAYNYAQALREDEEFLAVFLC